MYHQRQEHHQLQYPQGQGSFQQQVDQPEQRQPNLVYSQGYVTGQPQLVYAQQGVFQHPGTVPQPHPGWPTNAPVQFPPNSQYQAHQQYQHQQPLQHQTMLHVQAAQPAYPQMAAYGPVSNYPGPAHQYGQPMPMMQRQHQPNPAYTQQFVPINYSSGTRPQSRPTHSNAQFHPNSGAVPAAPFLAPTAISSEPHLPVQQQTQQPPQQQQQQPQSQGPREKKPLPIVNPETKQEVVLASSKTGAVSAATSSYQNSTPPPHAGTTARPNRGLVIEKPTDDQTVQKDLMKLRSSAKSGVPQPSTTTAAPATASPAISATSVVAPSAASSSAATEAAAAAPITRTETISVEPSPRPAKPPTPLPSPEQTELPLPSVVSDAVSLMKDDSGPPSAQKSQSPAAADSPLQTAQQQKSPVATPMNGDATDGSRQSSASRKASTDAGHDSVTAVLERRSQPPTTLLASGKSYDFKPEPGESEKTTLEKKLKYDRQFLLSLQFTDLSSQRPDELPGDIPELLPRSDSQQQPRAVRGFDFTPSYVVQPTYIKDKAKPAYSSHRGGSGRSGGGSGSGGGGPPKPPMKQQVVIEVRKDKVDLHKSDSAYVPGFLQQKKPDDQEQAKKEDIERNIRSILNKIAPQNFESCFSQLTTTCDIGSIGGLNACVDIIFDKATREKSYSSVFAEICKRLAFLKVNFPDQPQAENKQFVGFRSLLLKKCQDMFETPLKDQMEQKAAQWQERIDSENDDKKKALEEERDEQVKKMKDQYYGNIRFIGELFMKDILTANIIHQCIVSQLKSDHGNKSMFTESLECLCELLKTVGKKLESENSAKGRIDQYFDRIKKLIKSKEIESKVRFRLQDIVEMRERKWERREMEIRLHERPMTKEELELKARQEEESKKQQLAGMQQTRGGRQGSYSRPPAGPPVPATATSEWTAVTTTRKAQKMDARKMVIGSSQEQGQAQTRLGPQRPSFVAKARPGGKEDGGRGTPKFGSQKNSRESSASRGTSRDASPHRDAPLQQPTVAALAASGKMPRSQSSVELPARAIETPVMPRDVLERRSKNIMMEWLGSLCSLEDTKASFAEIAQHPQVSVFVEANAEHLLNENSKELRERGGQLLFELLNSDLLSTKDLIEGFSPIMEMAEDFLSDFPLLSSYLGEIFSSFVQKAASYLPRVQQLLLKIPAELRDSSRRPLRGEILSRALHLASGRLGHERVGAAFREAGIVWHNLLELPDAAAAADFVAVNKLEFTLQETPMSPSPLSLDAVGEQIEHKIISADDQPSTKDLLSEELIAIIEKEVDKKLLETRKFMQVLVRSVCRSCIQNKKLNKGMFLLVKPVLMRHIETQEQQQQWVLSATCETVMDAGYSLSLINDLFFIYLENTIICEDSFKQWHQNASQELQDATRVFIKTLESTHSPSDS